MGTTFRELYEEREATWLSPYACLAKNSKGRLTPERDDPYRTCFQRDRDRIIHSKAFRRLKRKTQVFLAPLGDHYRTRLTHTLEVVQIARSIARVLRLNEDLTEAIALGHDLGHTPFGHAGERVLNELSPYGFNHAEQSLRVVDILEQRQGKRGLNLSHEVREGIRDHSKGKCILFGEPCPEGISFEALIVSISDVIAYITHDIDDAIRANILTIKELPQNALKILGTNPSKQIDTMVRGVIEGSLDKSQIQIIPEIKNAIIELRTFLFEKLYPSQPIAREIQKAQRIVSELFYYFMKNPPKDLIDNKIYIEESLERKVTDFLAGMTDEYALNTYQKLFLPSPWHT